MYEALKASMRYENGSHRNRLIVEMPGDVNLTEYEAEMIRHNRIENVLPLEILRVNDRVDLIYDVTGIWRLKDLLDNRVFDVQEFLSFINRMIHTLKSSEVYLLNMNRFALCEEMIYINSDLQPYLLYVPLHSEGNVHWQFKEFMVQMVVYRAKIKGNDSGPILSSLLNELKGETFNLFDLHKKMSSLKGSAGSVIKEDAPSGKQQSLSIRGLVPPENRVVSTDSSRSGSVGKTPGPHKEGFKLGVGDASERGTYRYKKTTYLAAGFFFIALLLSLWMAYDPVLQMTEDPAMATLSLGLLAISLMGLVLRRIFCEKNRVKVMTKEPQIKRVEEFSGRFHKEKPLAISALPDSINRDTGNSKFEVLPVSPEMPGVRASVPVSADTVILSTRKTAPYLRRKGGFHDVILLTGANKVIGRQKTLSDVVIDESTIGRMHAEVFLKEEEVYIRDLNSKNGTYVNGRRLTGDQQFLVSPGDIVQIGALEYVLEQE